MEVGAPRVTPEPGTVELFVTEAPEVSMKEGDGRTLDDPIFEMGRVPARTAGPVLEPGTVLPTSQQFV